MLSGRRLDLLDPSPLDIEIEDIAHGLARVPRWNGQTTGDHAFSVAEHSILVETLARRLDDALTPADRLAALLHDAPEYVLGDMISPVKHALGGGYQELERRLEAAVYLRFGLPPKMRPALKKTVKRADRISAYYEAVQIAGFSVEEAKKFFGAPPRAMRLRLKPLSVVEAQAAFLERFERLSAARDRAERSRRAENGAAR